MTLLENLKNHKGGLIRIKTDLFWYKNWTYDNKPGRICLVMDVSANDYSLTEARTKSWTKFYQRAKKNAAVHLLINGQPYWIGMSDNDVELINDTV